MPKFRYIPREFEAIQFTGENWVELIAFCGTRKNAAYNTVPAFGPVGTLSMFVGCPPGVKAELWCESRQQHVGVAVGDWVFKGLNGFNAIEDDTFKTMFEEVKEE